MAGKPQSSIRLAIRACIVRCSQSPTSVLCLAEFLEELRCMGWNDESVQQVEDGTLSAMRQSSDRELLLA